MKSFSQRFDAQTVYRVSIVLFVLLSLFYIVYGYAALGTNDDWALRNMLHAHGVYGTLIMSYPLSFVMSKLYDFFPSVPWYSGLLSLLMFVHFYLYARFLATLRRPISIVVLLVLGLMWLSYLWFNMTITIMTAVTVLNAVGLIRRHPAWSVAMLGLAALLRLDIMVILTPYYAVAFGVLYDKDRLRGKRKAIGLAAVWTVAIVALSIVLQKHDTGYSDWLRFNKARSAIVDMGVMRVDKRRFYTPEEQFYIDIGWWQDEKLLPTERVLAATPSLGAVLRHNLAHVDLVAFLAHHKFRHWIWLLMLMSVAVTAYTFRSKRWIFMGAFVVGTVLLLITRDVERVTVALMMMWALIVFDAMYRHTKVRMVFAILFTAIFYYYAQGQFGYRYYKENTALVKEARDLIAQSGKKCDVAITYPTIYTGALGTVFSANYLFREADWMQMNDTEVLPGGWLSRHPYFYRAHRISHGGIVRKYADYHDFLVDDDTAFFGSKYPAQSEAFERYLLRAYDKRYLSDRPQCRHRAVILRRSKHFAISQIRIECDENRSRPSVR